MSYIFNNNQEVKNDEGNALTVVGNTKNKLGKNVLTVDDDTVQHTSRGRRKVSTFEITDFNSFNFGVDSEIWDQKTTGTAAATHKPFLSMVELSVGSAAGDEIIRQTRRVQRYLPGRQNEVSMSLVLGAEENGVRKRYGIFDNKNGVYFEYYNQDYTLVIRRNTEGGVVENRIPRANWNIDKVDGTGPSGIIANPNMIQLMVIEYEWYGAGSVEWKFVIGNTAYPLHKEQHANIIDRTWSSTAALPVRLELTNVAGIAGPHSMLQGSHAFLTEGTSTLLGRQSSISDDITGKTLTNANTFYPLVAIRLKSTALSAVVIPDKFAAGLLDKTDLFVRSIEGAVVTGGTWVSSGPDSPIEYNITATSFTGGKILDTNFISEKQMGVNITYPERSITQLQRTTTTELGDTASVFLIAGAAVDALKLGWASLGWIEIR